MDIKSQNYRMQFRLIEIAWYGVKAKVDQPPSVGWALKKYRKISLIYRREKKN